MEQKISFLVNFERLFACMEQNPGVLVTVPTYIAESGGNWSAAGTENPGNFIGLRIIHIGWFSGVLIHLEPATFV